ncbi:putative salicylate hydroxylase [Xylariaceae sp. FL1019]|nr:putative salicylate hydroxylase [Xylariaceae sp. FL1019]
MAVHSNENLFVQRRAVKNLNVIVVGAGIAGLTIGLCMRRTGHNVRILEKRMEITAIGAGIQLAPNANRILRRLGVLDDIMKHATILQHISLRRWKNNEELGRIPLVPRIEEEFGAPMAIIQRPDLHSVLLEAAKSSGRLAVRHVENLKWMTGDLIIAADGVNSLIRKQMLENEGLHDELVPTGHIAYRFTLTEEMMKSDENMMALLRETTATRFMGPDGHIMAYPLRDNTQYNVVLLCRATRDGPLKTSWTTKGDKAEMVGKYCDWCPIVRALVSYVPDTEVLETTMSDLPPLKTWVNGQVCLAGDSAHYMLPYVAQGAANGIEDAAVLAMAFTCTDDVQQALEVYQLVRKGRSERIKATTEETGNNLHMPDGEAQRRRDELIRSGSRGEGTNPDKWNDRNFNEFMWGVDVMAQTVNDWDLLVQNAASQRVEM